MALNATPLRCIHRYNGVTLEAPAGATVDDVKRLNSAIYPELLNAVPDYGPIENGTQTITFSKPALRDKGAGQFREFVDAVRIAAEGRAEQTPETVLVADLQSAPALRAGKALKNFAGEHAKGIPAPSAMLGVLI